MEPHLHFETIYDDGKEIQWDPDGPNTGVDGITGRINPIEFLAEYYNRGCWPEELMFYEDKLSYFSQLFDSMKGLLGSISDSLSTLFNRARQLFTSGADPLTLDLDGDGMDTVGIDTNNPILFDHNADGVKTATGWIKGDDGLLVLDRNNNGTIDSGKELFGDNTVMSNGQTAADGFAAKKLSALSY